MNGCTTEETLKGIVRQMKYVPAFLRSSLTYDLGSEMACFEQLSYQLNMDVRFCDPHAP